ncbi:MAG: glycosyltransferase family 39 protein [Acidobacteria bacterium]|nr:glycosyltransferase family 39 protein [Acidobacteriota bacterium]
MSLLLAALSAIAIWFHVSNGYSLYLGDAAAHLNIARRWLDTRQAGPHQIGTVWLPVPHLFTMPFARVDEWWRSGLAGAIPAGACFVVAGTFLYAAVRRVFASKPAATAATLLFALNPNVLYLQTTPLTEPYYFAWFAAMLYASVTYAATNSLWPVVIAGIASNLASLTRYEGWFLIPFLALYFALAGKRTGCGAHQQGRMNIARAALRCARVPQMSRRIEAGILFGTIAILGPLWWLAHNWWFYGNALEFYNGPYSAMAIYQRQLVEGMERYPGDHNWWKAFGQFSAATRLCAGVALVILGLAGIITALWKRAFWAVGFLLLPAAFYVWSIYGSGTPIYVPHLWPNSYYNTRYGLAGLPLLVLCAASLVAVVPQRLRAVAAILVVLSGSTPWLSYPRPESWITWKEAQVNGGPRRQYTAEAAEYLKSRYVAGQGIYMNFGDLSGILQQAGIPLSEALDDGSHPWYNAVEQRPDLFLHEEWAIAISGDSVATALLKDGKRRQRYVCEKMIMNKGAPVIEIYRRQSVLHDDPLHQSPRRQE